MFVSNAICLAWTSRDGQKIQPCRSCSRHYSPAVIGVKALIQDFSQHRKYCKPKQHSLAICVQCKMYASCPKKQWWFEPVLLKLFETCLSVYSNFDVWRPSFMGSLRSKALEVKVITKYKFGPRTKILLLVYSVKFLHLKHKQFS